MTWFHITHFYGYPDSTVTLGQTCKNIYFSCFMGGDNPYLNISGFCGSHHISFMNVIDFALFPGSTVGIKGGARNTN